MASVLMVVPIDYRGTFIYLVVISAALVISAATITIANFVGGVRVKHQLLFELCWVTATSTVNLATLIVVVIMQAKFSCGPLFHSGVSICRVNSLSVIAQSFGVACNIVQVYLLLVILRHARTLSKRPLKTILLTPTSKLPELIPGRSSFTACPIPRFHQSNATPLSAIYISGPEDIGTGLLESDYGSRTSLSSSRYPTTSSFSGEGRSSSDTVRSSNSLRLPPLPPPHSPKSDRFTRPPPRASVRRELRRGREVL
ncbi:hypothetical protein FS837_006673 [Tulasnella sp. UAMH 9824]|nr:hypothetical protein FS837_006673 [Tulasnella sp. UAMH 9824]